MPQLKNPRHELLAQGIAQGKTRKVAHKDAGYNGRPEAVKRMMKLYPDIQRRADELLGMAADLTVKAGADVINGVWDLAESMRTLALAKKGKKNVNRVSAAQAATQAYGLLGRHYKLWEGDDGNREADSLPLVDRLKKYRGEKQQAQAIEDSGGKVVPIIKKAADADD